METSPFTCPICYLDFGSANRVPKIIPNCGHTVCSDCLLKIKNNPNINTHKCPFDQNPLPQSIDSCPKNFSLVRIIEEKAEVEKCEIHNHKEVNYLCMTDQKKICGFCYIEHQKKQHNLVPIEAVQIQLGESIGQINAFLKDVKTYHKNLILKVQENHQKQIEFIKKKLKILRNFIDEKEEEMIFESKCCLANNEFELEMIFGENSQVFAKFSKQRVELENILSCKNYFFEDFSEEIIAEIQDYRSKINQNNLKLQEAEMSSESNHFEKSLMNLIEDVKKSLNNAKMPYQLNNFDKIIMTFSDQETKEVIISGINETLSTFTTKSNLIIEYSEGKLMVQNNKQNLSDIPVKIEKWSGLHTIQLDLEQEISKEDFQLLHFIWKMIVNPSNLEITLRPEILADNPNQALLQTISTKTEFLEEFSLQMPYSKLSNQPLNDKNLLPFFVKMQNLKRFRLSILNNSVTEQTFEKCGQTLASSPLLEEITLHVYGVKITDLCVENILSNLKNLKKLDFNLSATSITDKTVHLLSQTLSKSPLMENLQVWLTDTNIGDPNFMKLVKPLPNVKNFSLNLTGTKISDKTFETLIANTFLSMKKIESLLFTYGKQK